MIRILSEYSTQALEEALDKIFKENPASKLVHLSVHPMHDMYTVQAPPTVCNSWSEYLAAVEVP